MVCRAQHLFNIEESVEDNGKFIMEFVQERGDMQSKAIFFVVEEFDLFVRDNAETLKDLTIYTNLACNAGNNVSFRS